MRIEDVGALVEFLAAQYPNWKAPANTVAAWYSTLGSADTRAVLQAAHKWSVTNKWPPSVADLIEGVMASTGSAPAPEDVMAEILRAVKDTPWGEGPKGLSSVAQSVVECIGWAYVTDSENPMALRSQLLRLCETYCRRHAEDRAYSMVGLPATPRPVALPDAGTQAGRRDENGILYA